MRSYMLVLGLMITTLAACSAPSRADEAKPPEVNAQATDFSLQTLDGEKVQLTKLLEQGPVVLVVLRGYPGYQCPACNAQVGQFLAKAKQFDKASAQVVLVYPGPGKELQAHAAEFIRGKTLPKNVSLVTDPDYTFTKAYGLRWDAANETAYPSTFVVNKDGKFVFAKISHTHGDRAKADDVLKALE